MKKYKLGDICEIVSGSTPKTNIAEFWDGDVKWITPAELDENTYIITDSVRKITDLAMQKTGLTAFPAGTVILSSRAPIGKVAIAGCKMCCNQGFKNFICSELVNNKYLYWFLKHNTAYLNSLGRGATFKEISKSIVSSIEINLPSLEEQQRVVDNIEKISTIITLRKKEISILDDLIKARFIELFGEPLSNQKGWQTMSIVEAAPIKSQRGDLGDEVWLLNLDAVEAQTGTVLFKHRVQSGKINASTVFFTTESVLYSKLRPYLNKVVMPNEDGVATSEMIPMYPLADRLNRAYLCYWLRSDAFVRHISEKVAGAKMPRVSMDYFRSLAIELPPLELQGQFADFVAQIDKSKATVQKALDETQLLFDSLMQQYFG